jgi:hypothetical protein
MPRNTNATESLTGRNKHDSRWFAKEFCAPAAPMTAAAAAVKRDE